MLYIYTLNWNKCDALTKLKETLLPNLTDINYVWAIKDNASTDNSFDVASAWDENKKSIHLFKYANNSQNFSEGVNYLYSQTTPNDNDYILLLNNDVVFNDTQSIKKMLTVINKDKNVGVVGARLLFPNTNKLQHAGVIFEAPHRLPMHYRIHETSDKTAEQNRLFQAVTGAVLLIKAEYLKLAHKNNDGTVGLDNSFRWAFDDIALCLSVGLNMKKKIVYCGQTNISHESSASLKKNPVNKLFMSHNVNKLLEKWGGRYIVDKQLYLNDSKHNLYNG